MTAPAETAPEKTGPGRRPVLLVTGAAGQVGTELQRAPGRDAFDLVTLDRGRLDIADSAAVARVVAEAAPDLVINAAAYTAVDRAESEPDAAFAANRDGPAALAAACAARAVPIVHLSTDYVFDGSKTGPWREDDPIAPLSTYGRSKAEGEAAVRTAAPRHVILRTAWVYAAHGRNFVRTMLRLGGERDRLQVVNDQWGCPTAAGDIAAAILAIAPRLIADPGAPWGTYHVVSRGRTTWFGFAQAIFTLAAAAGRPCPVIEPIPTSAYPTPAVRPANSVLDTARFTAAFGLTPPVWQEGLARVMKELL